MGFCFGGGMVWTLLASGEPRLAAAASFYGPLPEGGTTPVPENAAVLGRYSEQDGRVNATRDAARTPLQEAGLTSHLVTYPNAGYALLRTPVSATTPTAAAAAYTKLIDWFGNHLG